MTNFINNSRNFTERRGLYCVWVRARNDGNAPLVSIWIDPTMAAFDPCQESGELTGISGGTVSEEIEDHLHRIPSARSTWHSLAGDIYRSKRHVVLGLDTQGKRHAGHDSY
jgi:hypothetical protein